MCKGKNLEFSFNLFVNTRRRGAKFTPQHSWGPKFKIGGYYQGCELIGRPEKVSIALETTFEVKCRPFGYHFEDNWKPIIELSIVK